jgi:hypothetical protein
LTIPETMPEFDMMFAGPATFTLLPPSWPQLKKSSPASSARDVTSDGTACAALTESANTVIATIPKKERFIVSASLCAAVSTVNATRNRLFFPKKPLKRDGLSFNQARIVPTTSFV